MFMMLFYNFVHVLITILIALLKIGRSKESTNKIWVTSLLSNACRKKNKHYTIYVNDPTLEYEEEKNTYFSIKEHLKTMEMNLKKQN